MQSHYHAPYTPGRGQLVFVTFCFGAALTNAGEERGAGYYDGVNGISLVQDSAGVKVQLITSTEAADESVYQANWNLDKLNGTGPSGLTLDITKTQILVIQIQALYVGRLVVALDIDGEIVPIHTFCHANRLTKPYIAQASLPIRYWAKSAAASASAVTMTGICASVISEGGGKLPDMEGRPFTSSGSLTNTAEGTLLVVRCKAQLNSINQNAVVVPLDLDVAVADAGCWFEIRRNATITAGTFTNVHTASTMEESFAGNAGTDPVVTAGTGTLVSRFYVPSAAASRGQKTGNLIGKTLLAYSHLLGVGDSLSVLWNGGGVTTDVFGSLSWKEIR